MADRRVIARLRITPCGLFEPVTHTISLHQINADYRLEVFERNGLTRKQSRRRIEFGTTEVQEQLSSLQKATVPAFPVSPMVCDGEYVELMVEGEFSTLTLGWWTIAPQGAEKFSNFADWLRETGLGRDEEQDDENG